MKTAPENKYIKLLENEYSGPIDINSYYDDPNIKKLSNSSNRSKDPVIKIQLYNKNQFRFKVHNHCGYLKIGPNSYFVEPKMGKAFLETMFEALNRSDHSKYRFHEYKNDLKQDDIKKYFDEFIAYLFIGSFKRSLSGKVRRGYINKNISTYKSSGKIDIDKSKEFFSYFIKPPTWLRNEWNKDTKFNKALRVLFLNLSHLNVSNGAKSKLVKIGLELADSDCIGDINYHQLLYQLDRVHENYKPLFELAVSLNINGGISSGAYKSSSLLLETWSLFENACKLTIADLLPSQFEINLEDSFAERVSEVVTNDLKPDIVIKNKRGDFYVKIGDCKYIENNECKLKPDHFYQLNTYMDAYKLPESFILYPNAVSKREEKPYPLKWGNQINIVNVPIDNYDKFRSGLKDLLRDLLPVRLNVS